MLHSFGPLVIVALGAQAAHALHATNLARQTSTDCETPCTTLSNAVTPAESDGLASICTSSIVNDYAACYGCLVQIGELSQESAQETFDCAFLFLNLQENIVTSNGADIAFATGCQEIGDPVSSITISSDGSTSGGSSSAGSSGTASGSAGSAAAPAKKGSAGRTSAGLLGLTASVLVVCVAAW
ncbi:hypothetical protein DFH07DRAFT_1008653 [Mycena maculata]|uniref:Uncharacterized protein n=1 Tax=Mycena maculata TaxID=230809 RepID=A0AAD7HH41_9AGAR|nr:hypothetical protein DFH07DRAFT_1008653 [Mycena maculata]